MQIDRLIEYLQQLPEDTEILRWDGQQDAYLPVRKGMRINMQIELFAPAGAVVSGEVVRPTLEVKDEHT